MCILTPDVLNASFLQTPQSSKKLDTRRKESYPAHAFRMLYDLL
jgi:hypothetical protein